MLYVCKLSGSHTPITFEGKIKNQVKCNASYFFMKMWPPHLRYFFLFNDFYKLKLIE